MHENREISRTPWSEDQGRSAKAINQTADMNVREKSDCAVVPVNQPNNEGQPFAEAGEGRAQIEENTVQSRMRPTQSGKRMSQGLHGVRQAAKERKQERFTALLHHVATRIIAGDCTRCRVCNRSGASMPPNINRTRTSVIRRVSHAALLTGQDQGNLLRVLNRLLSLCSPICLICPC